MQMTFPLHVEHLPYLQPHGQIKTRPFPSLLPFTVHSSRPPSLRTPRMVDPEGRSSRGAIGGGMDDVDSFLAGLRVLAVDDDHVCLKILEMQLRHCKYNVTAVAHAETALEMLRARKDGGQFDLVISDVHMPDMDGFKLLELVGIEMDIPVIMLSANEETETMKKGIMHGACDYLVKPVHLNRLKTIWLHVVKKSRNDPKNNYISGADNDAGQKHQSRDAKDGEKNGGGETKKYPRKNKKDGEKIAGDEAKKYSRKNKKEGDGPEEDGVKRPRIQWSGDLHRKFVEVVHQIGFDRAVPKRILELMNVDGIDRDQVGSHLQKYRIGLQKLSQAANKLSTPPFAGEPETSRRDLNYMNMNGLDSSSSALVGVHPFLHPHQSVQSMSSQRNLTVPLIGPAGNNGGNLLNGAVQGVITSSGISHGSTSIGGLSSGGLFFPSPSNGYTETMPNGGMALNACRYLPFPVSGSSFAGVSNGNQPLATGLGNSWNAEVPLMFPGGDHSHGIFGVASQGNGIETNQLSGLPMPFMGNEFQNHMATVIRTSAPVAGFGEQQAMPFNLLGSNANSVPVMNGTSALTTSALSIGSSALPNNIQIHNSDTLLNLLENDGSVDQQAADGLMGTSDLQSQMSGDLGDFLTNWLNN